MQETVETIGDRVAAARAAKGWSTERLARETLLSSVTIWRVETNRTVPTLAVLTAIAAALGTTVGDLLGEAA